MSIRLTVLKNVEFFAQGMNNLGMRVYLAKAWLGAVVLWAGD